MPLHLNSSKTFISYARPIRLMTRFPESSPLRPQTRRRSGPPTRVTDRAALIAKCRQESIRQTVLVQPPVVEVEAAVGILAELLAAVAPLADPEHRQSVHSAGHPSVAAAPIS